MKSIIAATLAACFLMAGIVSAQAQEAVKVRGGQHDGYGRIVFDWPEAVQHRVTVENNRLRVAFDKKASFQTGRLFPALNAYIGQAAQGPHGYRITFPLKDDYGIKKSTYGNKIIIDLVDTDQGPDSLPTVRVRAGSHETYDRLVFDWPKAVGYRVTTDRAAGQATITFDRPAQLDLSDYRQTPLSRILAVTPFPADEQIVAELDVKAGARIRDFTLDRRIVVDVFEPGAAPSEVAGQSAEDRNEQQKTRSQDQKDDESEAPDARTADGAEQSGGTETAANDTDSAVNGDVSPEPDTADQTRATDRGETAATENAEADGTPGAPTQLVPQENGGGTSANDSGASGAAPSLRRSESEEPEAGSDPQQAASVQPPAVTSSSAGAETAGVLRMAYTPERIAQGLAPKAGETPRHVPPTQIDLPWAGKHAAVFRRAGSLFLIADGAPPTRFAQQLVDAAGGVRKVEQSLKGDVAIVRMHTAPEMGARLLRQNGVWQLSLRPRATLPGQPLSINAEKGRVLLPTNEPGQVVQLEDPGSGSPLHVATVGAIGQGLPLEKRFQEFTLLGTTQGVAVLPLASHVVIETTEDGIVIRGRDRALAVSETDLSRSASGTDTRDGARLLKLAEWRRPDQPYDNARQTLQQAVADAAEAKKHLARLDLARFYFAHGLAAEALGALRLYTKERPRREKDPQVQLMKGAAHLLAGDWQEAGRTLADPSLDGVKEALPWRAAHAMAAGNDRSALAAFERARDLLDPYPPSVRKQLRLWAAETYLRVGNVPKANRQMKILRNRNLTSGEAAEVAYLNARSSLLNNEVEKAEDLWRELAKGDHAPTRAQARFVMIERDLAAERIDRQEAIERLERLRFAWRGDEFEAVLLDRLADLYLAGEQYRPALETLEEAASHLPDTPQAERAAGRMRDIFERLFLEGEADKMPAIKALALYESFRELTPPGKKGNRLVAKLADRLVNVDLLRRAADLLDGQVRHRLSGREKSRTGARLASIYLLDQAPEKALEALNISRQDNLPEDLRTRRRYLRARTLLNVGRGSDALVPIANDNRPEAIRIRAKIHADMGNWDKVADNLAALLPDTPAAGEALPEADIAKVIRQAVAVTLADDTAAAKRLRRRYADAMAQTSQADTFDLLTQNRSNDPTEISSQLAQVQRAKTFVDGFLNSLRQQASLNE